MKLQQLDAQEALRSLHGSSQGLSASEAQHRLLEFGPNKLTRLRREPRAFRFLKQCAHVFALVLWARALLAFFAELNDPGNGMGTLGVAIVAVILINAAFSFW